MSNSKTKLLAASTLFLLASTVGATGSEYGGEGRGRPKPAVVKTSAQIEAELKAAAINKNDIANAAEGGKASTGPISISEETKFPVPIGNAPSVYIQPTGDCGDGWILSVGGPYGALGGGQTGQDHFCISNKAAMAAMNAGIKLGDNGLVAAGFGALRKLHPEFEAAASIVSQNLVKECGAAAGKRSVVLLSEPDLACEGQKFSIAPQVK